MTIQTTNALEGVLDRRRHTLCKCWRIAREDGVVFRYTSHNRSLTFGIQGEALEYTYNPTKSMNASATQRESQLKVNNSEYRGVITSDDITAEALRAGLYDDAEIREYTVDWSIPWMGPFATEVYWINSVSWNGETWDAEISGYGRWLEPILVQLFSRQCRHALFSQPSGRDAGACNLLRNTYIRRDMEVDVVTDRENFEADDTLLVAPNGDGYFDFGLVIWTSGNNVGHTSEVRTYLNTDRAFSLQLPTPFDIQVDDTFDLEPGCNKTQDHCINKYNNYDNYGGFPFLPGEDGVRETPG